MGAKPDKTNVAIRENLAWFEEKMTQLKSELEKLPAERKAELRRLL